MAKKAGTEEVKKTKGGAVKVKRAREKGPTDKLADKSTLTKILQGVFGDAQKSTLKRLAKRVVDINKLEPKYEKMSDKELAGQTEKLRKEITKLMKVAAGDSDKSDEKTKKGTAKKVLGGLSEDKALDKVLPDAFAVVREASKRVLGMRPFDVQMIGGVVLHEGNIAEMKTGEGKTLVVTMPIFLNSLMGKGVHLVTVNDYLAQYHAGWMGGLYDFLGLSVGVIINEASFVYDKDYENEAHTDPYMRKLKPATRKEAYASDVTYGTNNEFGFDYLRDNMVNEVGLLRQRELHFAIVDEADSILIDEARTPLIISAPAGDNPESYYQFAKIAAKLGDKDYVLDEKRRAVSLTDEGVDKVQKLLGVAELYAVENTRLVYHMNQALRAQTVFTRDKDYVVTNSGEVIIVDEHTGRLMHGRRYNEGLHQAIEAKEAVAVKEESMTLATISFQNFFRLYKKLSGMTGTAFTEAEEFQQIYALDVVQIPTNKPIKRVDEDDLIYRTEMAKIKAITDEIKKYHKEGRPVLVGSASIAKNELIAEYLKKEGIPFEILNAKNNEREAAIIAKAGEKGAVTLATNMAGRGTDIKLGKGVVELGGLVVIGSERHESRRIDNQLRGRGGRQGDPGTTQFFVSTEDDLMRIFQGERVSALMSRMKIEDDTPIQIKAVTKMLEAAQKRIEGFNFDSRKNVVQYDNVINRHRRVVYLMRRKILDGDDIRPEIGRLMREAVEELMLLSSRVNKKFVQDFQAVFNLPEEKIEAFGKLRKEKDREKVALAAVQELYAEKEAEFGDEIMRKIEREVYLKVLDMLWMQHLENMQHLREGIHWRSIGQRDPLVEYRSEAQTLFDGLQRSLREEVLKVLLSVTRQDVPKLADDEYDSELTKMAAGATEKGVNEVSSSKKHSDKEFSEEKDAEKKGANGTAVKNKKKNQLKKSRKKARQNKKQGRK
jgi:preprotein translocase subunit SecA